MDNRPIGVFDSGLGGLTVVKELISQLPNESIVYFGDTARIPYGSRSREIVTKYSAQCIRFLLSKNIKMVVIACNTASSFSLLTLRQMFDVPIIGVIEPGAIGAVNSTKTKKVGVVGTAGTIRSKAYINAIKSLDSEIEVIDIACPLFVPIVEEGWSNTEIARLTVEKYLEPLKKAGVDTLVLGCTHYPLLSETISKYLGGEVTLINPAEGTATQVKNELIKSDSVCQFGCDGKLDFYVSDFGQKFKEMGSRFLNRDIGKAERIDIENYG